MSEHTKKQDLPLRHKILGVVAAATMLPALGAVVTSSSPSRTRPEQATMQPQLPTQGGGPSQEELTEPGTVPMTFFKDEGAIGTQEKIALRFKLPGHMDAEDPQVTLPLVADGEIDPAAALEPGTPLKIRHGVASGTIEVPRAADGEQAIYVKVTTPEGPEAFYAGGFTFDENGVQQPAELPVLPTPIKGPNTTPTPGAGG